MIGDTVILSRKSKKKAKFIINQLKSNLAWNKKLTNKNLREVWDLEGESGVLKTETSLEVQLLLWTLYKIRVHIISLDDFYFNWFNERNTIRKQKGISSVGVKEIEWNKINTIINSFRKKQLLRLEQIHRFCETDVYSTIDSKFIDILLFEGLYGGWLKKNNCSDFSIFLEGNIKQTEKFRKKRGKEKIDDFRKKVLIKESKDVKKTKKYADLIIPWNI